MKFLKKKKLTVMIAAGLAGVSLSSVGFAGWVINAQTEASKDVTITFGKVTDNAYSAELSAPTDLELKFDCKVKGKSKNDIQGDGTFEDLHIGFTFKIFKSSDPKEAGVEVYKKVENATIEFISPEGSPFADLVTGNFICSPITLGTPTNISLASTAATETAGAGANTKTKYTVKYAVGCISVDCEYTFAWGSNFGGVNPQDMTDNGEAQKQLAAFHKIAEGKTGKLLNIKITPVLKATAQ